MNVGTFCNNKYRKGSTGKKTCTEVVACDVSRHLENIERAVSVSGAVEVRFRTGDFENSWSF